LLKQEKLQVRRQAKAYSSYIANLEKEEKRLRDQALLQEERAKQYATADLKRKKLTQASVLQQNRHREEVKARREAKEREKAHSELMSRQSYSPPPMKIKQIQQKTLSTSTLIKPKSVKSLNFTVDTGKFDIKRLFLLKARTEDCTRRSEILRLNYKDKLHFHSRKVLSTQQTTEVSEIEQQQSFLLSSIAKCRRSEEYCKNKEKRYQEIGEKAGKSSKEKAKKAKVRRFFLENQTEQRLKEVETTSNSKINSAAESLHTSLSRTVAEKQAIRSRKEQDWEANYALQLQRLNQSREQLLAKKLHTFEALSALQQERNKQLEAKLRADFLHKRKNSLR
jgi:hypothetical protein